MSHLLFKLVLFVYIHDMSKYTGLPTKKETLKTIQDMTIQDMTIQDMTNPRYDDLSLVFLHLIKFFHGLLNNK